MAPFHYAVQPGEILIKPLKNPLCRWVIILIALLIALGFATRETGALSIAPNHIVAPKGCEFDVLQGKATHVGHSYYPWEETVELRKNWGQLPEGWEIEKRGHLAALHEAMVDASWIGRRALVVSHETGHALWVDIVDAMAAGDRHPNPAYHGRVIDLTPEMFGWLLRHPDGPHGRGGQQVTVLFPRCDGVVWPVYD